MFCQRGSPSGEIHARRWRSKRLSWQSNISAIEKGGAYAYPDGSLLEGRNVGGGAFVVGNDGAEEEVESGIGHVATVWDGEGWMARAGMAEGLGRVCRGGKVLIFADSKPAILAARKAGRTGRARSHHLRKVVDEIGKAW